MKQMIFKLLLGSFASIGALTAADAITDSATNASFPGQVTVNNVVLDATGVATRKKFFVKVYSVAHYMQSPQKGSELEVLEEVFDGSKAKQLTTQWVRNVDSKTIQKGYRDTFEKTLTPEQLKDKSAQIEQFIGFFDQDAQSGDEHIIRWLPGGIIEVDVNGDNKGQIKDEAFAKDVWSIWLGPKSVVPRNNLISQFTN